MEVTAVILYKGALAHYTVEKSNGLFYSAHLIRYGGQACDKPPKHLHFIEEGRHCSGNSNNQDLMDDLCYTAKQQMDGLNPPFPDEPVNRDSV